MGPWCVVAAHLMVLAAGRSPEAGESVRPNTLRKAVVIVRPHYAPEIQRLFKDVAVQFESAALQASDKELHDRIKALADLYYAHADSPRHGSGWLVHDADDQWWAVTNSHVLSEADSVTLEWADGYRAKDCPVAYADGFNDLAVIAIPNDKVPSSARALTLSEEPLSEGDDVLAAGFPSVPGGTKEIFQPTKGIVNSVEFSLGENMPVLIQHSATLDQGSSGGPIVVKDVTAPLGFKAVGINVATVRGRNNVNLAIPVSRAVEILEKAREAWKLRSNPSEFEKKLKQTAQKLADEMGSQSRDTYVVESLVSHGFVAAHCDALFKVARDRMLSGKMSPDELENFLTYPVKYMRGYMLMVFLAAYLPAEIAGIKVVRIVEGDVAEFDRRGTVRSVFLVSGVPEEVVWRYEQGLWKISDASFRMAPRPKQPEPAPPAAPPAPAPAPGVPGLGIELHAALSMRQSFGELTTDTRQLGGIGPGLNVALDIPLSRYFGIHLGAGYVVRGMSQTWVEQGSTYVVMEEVSYLTVPAAVRLDLPLEGSAGVLRFRALAGLAPEIIVGLGGTASVDLRSQALSGQYWNGHNGLNVAAVIGGSVEAGLGRRPSVLVGLDIVQDFHLGDEWSASEAASWGGQNVKYGNLGIGAHVTFMVPELGSPTAPGKATTRGI